MTVGKVCSVSRVEEKEYGVMVGLRARRRSGLSRMMRVLRWEVEERREMASEMAFWRCVRSRVESVVWPFVAVLVFEGAAGVDVVGWVDKVGDAVAGPRADITRPGGPRDGRTFTLLVGLIGGALCAACAGLLPFEESKHDALNPSTKANRPSRLSLSKSNPTPFRASCFQNSNSLIQLTSTTLCPSPPPLSAAFVSFSASHINLMTSQFALAPSVLVRSRSASSRGSCMLGCKIGGMRVDVGMAILRWGK